MNEPSLALLSAALLLLILLSAFFSASETAMMRLNRYRLRHLAESGHRGAMRAAQLLERPDRLIGIILLGNNFVNILASSIATLIALRYFGEAWIAVAAGILTFVILIFAELTPKTMAALHPERVAFPAAHVLRPLLTLCYPLVWVINAMANGLLRLAGISPEEEPMQQLSSDELRTVVNEAGTLIPRKHQKMLLNILDLEKVTIEDIMVPRNEIVGIDLEEDEEAIVDLLTSCQYTRLPVYREDIDNILGILHIRNALPLIAQEKFDKKALLEIAREPYFVPEGTPLNTQLLNFQRNRRRVGLVVDEYGDIEGLITLEDILEEIVGEFTTDIAETLRDVHPQEDGSFLVEGSANIRVLNRTMHWNLPTRGPKTLNGLITEHLESIPAPATSLRINGYTIEILQTVDNAVKTARILPPPEAAGAAEEDRNEDL
ncbi:MAG TPA: HlyC/CorC family transporter [Gammaproteobacteria bacterium]|nr:HlyC/CorC family transporter [Gammaproteobacteria bacterium]